MSNDPLERINQALRERKNTITDVVQYINSELEDISFELKKANKLKAIELMLQFYSKKDEVIIRHPMIQKYLDEFLREL